MNNKNLFKKTLEKAVSQLQMEPDEGAEDCGCLWDSRDNDVDFILDCILSDNAKISNVTESFCTKEPVAGGLLGSMTCKGRCKRVYTCTKSDPRIDPSKRVTTKTIYGKCADPVIGPGVEPTPSKPNLETI